MVIEALVDCFNMEGYNKPDSAYILKTIVAYLSSNQSAVKRTPSINY